MVVMENNRKRAQVSPDCSSADVINPHGKMLLSGSVPQVDSGTREVCTVEMVNLNLTSGDQI